MRAKLLGTVMVLAAVTLIGLAVLFQSDALQRATLHDVETIAIPLEQAAAEMEINVIGGVLAAVQFQATGDPAYAQRLRDDDGDFRRASSTYAAMARGADERDLSRRVAVKYERIHVLEGAVLAGSATAADLRELSRERERIDVILDEEVGVLGRRYLARAQSKADASAAHVVKIWALLLPLLGALLTGALVILARTVTQPLGRLAAGTAAVADGDLSHRVHVQGRDELAALADRFNAMVERLQVTLVGKAELEASQACLEVLSADLAVKASTDPLLGIPNRRELERRLDEALTSARQDGRHHAFCILDLDRFKVVNDTAGHLIGDELLRRVASTVTDRFRAEDTFARMGGDEFAVLLLDCDLEQATKRAERVRGDLEALRVVHDGTEFAASASIGVVPVSASGIDEILKAADSACYAAKERGRNRVQAFGTGVSEVSVRRAQTEAVPRIARALQDDRFVLDAQPIASLRPGGATQFCELLVRMVDEQGERIPPAAFIPAAERFGLMPKIDRWVMNAAFADIADRLRGRPAGPGSDIYAINLSALTISDPATPAFIEEQLARHDVPPSSICFEITETAAMTDLATAMRFIERVKALGCRLALDDFGSGMSSFTYLKHMPIDFLKIDGSFVRDMAVDRISSSFVRSMSEMGHVVGAGIIAEFVEDEQTLELLRDMGVDYAQGYVLGRPRPFAEIPVLSSLNV